MLEHDFAGWVPKRAGCFSAMCPAYPAGRSSDATVVDQVENSLRERAYALPDAVPRRCSGYDRSRIGRPAPVLEPKPTRHCVHRAFEPTAAAR